MPRPELASWMTPVDWDILRCLQNPGNEEYVLTPRLVAENTNWEYTTVREHLIELRDRSLVEYYDKEVGIYQLSDRGRAWLKGDLPTEELEDED